MSCSTYTADGYTMVSSGKWEKGKLMSDRVDYFFENQRPFYYLTFEVPGKVYGSDCNLKPLGEFLEYDYSIYQIVPNSDPIPQDATNDAGYIKAHKYTFKNDEGVETYVYEIIEDTKQLIKTNIYDKGATAVEFNPFHSTTVYKTINMKSPVLFLSHAEGKGKLYTKNDENPAAAAAAAAVTPAPAGGSKKRKQRKTGRKRKSKRTKTHKKLYKR